MKSVADLARRGWYVVDSMGQIYPMDDESCSDNIGRLLALHKAEVIKELCADEEPVAWRTFDGEGGYDFRGYEWNEDYQSRWDANNPKHIGWVDALYPAETVAALQARVARLEKDVIHWKEARQNAMAACELILAEVEALRSKKLATREWVGLTDAEIHNLDLLPHQMHDQERIDYAKSIEAKLKEKNA